MVHYCLGTATGHDEVSQERERYLKIVVPSSTSPNNEKRFQPAWQVASSHPRVAKPINISHYDDGLQKGRL